MMDLVRSLTSSIARVSVPFLPGGGGGGKIGRLHREHTAPENARHLSTGAQPGPFYPCAAPGPARALAERLACSSPTEAIRVQYPTGSLQILSCGNRAGRCHWPAGFLPFPSTLQFRRRSILTSITHIGSQDLDWSDNSCLMMHLASGFFFSGSSHFPCLCISTSPHTPLTSPTSALETSIKPRRDYKQYRLLAVIATKAKDVTALRRTGVVRRTSTTTIRAYFYLWFFIAGDRGGVVVRLLASHEGEPGSISGGVTPRFSQVGIVPDDDADQRVLSGFSRLPRHHISSLLHSHLTSPSSALKISLLRAAQISSLNFHRSRSPSSTLLGASQILQHSFWSTEISQQSLWAHSSFVLALPMPVVAHRRHRITRQSQSSTNSQELTFPGLNACIYNCDYTNWISIHFHKPRDEITSSQRRFAKVEAIPHSRKAVSVRNPKLTKDVSYFFVRRRGSSFHYVHIPLILLQPPPPRSSVCLRYDGNKTGLWRDRERGALWLVRRGNDWHQGTRNCCGPQHCPARSKHPEAQPTPSPLSVTTRLTGQRFETARRHETTRQPEGRLPVIETPSSHPDITTPGTEELPPVCENVDSQSLAKGCDGHHLQFCPENMKAGTRYIEPARTAEFPEGLRASAVENEDEGLPRSLTAAISSAREAIIRCLCSACLTEKGELGGWVVDDLRLDSDEIGNLRLDSEGSRKQSTRVCRTLSKVLGTWRIFAGSHLLPKARTGKLCLRRFETFNSLNTDSLLDRFPPPNLFTGTPA
ncbi:hypothetical protein PR048_032295 [Dryococelus australis]|uniref:Uncharacterized protein n=1 Tax=Dryococelus australis TaxID=614101 RepID=A0ABQ9G1U3_9NEOP|nr:hypothetical protein PR048_032295 [Dryococelus australis]